MSPDAPLQPGPHLAGECCPISPGPQEGELTGHRGLLLLLLRQLPELRKVRLQQLGNCLVGQAGSKWRRSAPGGTNPE